MKRIGHKMPVPGFEVLQVFPLGGGGFERGHDQKDFATLGGKNMWFVVFSSLGYIMLVTHKLFFLGKAILAIFQTQTSQFQQQRYFLFLYRVYFSFQ